MYNKFALINIGLIVSDVSMLGQKAAADSTPPFVKRSRGAGTAMMSVAQETTTAGRSFTKTTSCSQGTGTVMATGTVKNSKTV